MKPYRETYKTIRTGMRKNEAELLAYLRKAIRDEEPLRTTLLLGRAWTKALDRLERAGMVKYQRTKLSGYFRPRRYARPVTN